MSDPEHEKSDGQRDAERGLRALIHEVVDRDIPYLGTCYGLGILAQHLGAVVSKERYGEAVGSVTRTVTAEGKCDPLLAGLPETFRAFCGHTEACQELPHCAALLVRSDTCPVQMVRVGRNVYATQFHTELDRAGIVARIDAYKFGGYFPPEEAEVLKERIRDEQVHVPTLVLERFARRCKR